jgi:hypothetical protein
MIRFVLTIMLLGAIGSGIGCDKGQDSEQMGSVSGLVLKATLTAENRIALSPYSGASPNSIRVYLRTCEGWTGQGPSNCYYADSARVAQNGSFSIPNIVPGGYTVVAKHLEYGCGDSQYVDVTANNIPVDSLMIVDRCGFLVYGTARYNDGTVYANDTLAFFGADNYAHTGNWLGTVVTSDDGSYAVTIWGHERLVHFVSPRGTVNVYDPVIYGPIYCSIYDCSYYPYNSEILKLDPVIFTDE